MSGVLVIPNQFATAVTATGAQLDGDFNTVTAYINDPTNRNNYAADGGAATNTLTLTFSPPVVGGYTAGLEITFKATNTNTGAVVLNANGLGNSNLVNPDGSALQAGQLPAGAAVKAAYDGTRFIFLAPPVPATAAAVSAAVTLAPYVSPARMQNHPGVAKAWAQWNGTATGTINLLTFANVYNVSQIVRTGTGSYSITFSTPFSANNAAIMASSSRSGGGAPTAIDIDNNVTLTTSSVGLVVHVISTQTVIDVSYLAFVAYGGQ